MKTWGAVCGLLSAVLFGVLLASMHSCGDAYEIGADGQLFKTTKPDASKPATTRGPKCVWQEEFPEFPTLERWVQPGDRIHHSTTTAGLWAFEVQMRTLEVLRGEESVMLARAGHHRFWGMIVAVSLFPMICWGIGAFWIVTLSPRRGRETGS